MLSGSIAALRGGESGLRHMAGGSAAPSTRTAFVCSQGDQPNVHFELIENELSDTEGLTVSGGDPANTTLSIGNVVRGNVVRDKITPPWPEDPATDSWYKTARNHQEAIQVGIPARCMRCSTNAIACKCRSTSIKSFEFMLVEDNTVARLAKSPQNPSLPRPIPPSFPVLARACPWCLGARVWRADLPRGVQRVPNPAL